MDLDPHGATARGLRGYIQQISLAVGGGLDVVTVMLDRPLIAYVPLADRLPGYPDEDLALIWHEDSGWAAVVEADAREPVEVVRLGTDLVPPPDVVADFLTGLLSGDSWDQADRNQRRRRLESVERRLARYVRPVEANVP